MYIEVAFYQASNVELVVIRGITSYSSMVCDKYSASNFIYMSALSNCYILRYVHVCYYSCRVLSVRVSSVVVTHLK